PWVRIKLSKPGAVARPANLGVINERGSNQKQSLIHNSEPKRLPEGSAIRESG
ncbi:hypothetical protein ACVGV8_14885, partial [Enterobacter intestinihominis]